MCMVVCFLSAVAHNILLIATSTVVFIYLFILYYIIYFRLVVYIVTCTVYITISASYSRSEPAPLALECMLQQANVTCLGACY